MNISFLSACNIILCFNTIVTLRRAVYFPAAQTMFAPRPRHACKRGPLVQPSSKPPWRRGGYRTSLLAWRFCGVIEPAWWQGGSAGDRTCLVARRLNRTSSVARRLNITCLVARRLNRTSSVAGRLNQTFLVASRFCRGIEPPCVIRC